MADGSVDIEVRCRMDDSLTASGGDGLLGRVLVVGRPVEVSAQRLVYV